MKRIRIVWAVGAVLSIGGVCLSGEDEQAPPNEAPSLGQRDTLTDDWFGLGKRLSEGGLTFGLSATQIYQANVKGGVSTHRGAGRCAGSYDLEVGFDLEKLMKLRGASLFMLAEGSWSEGIDASSVGSLFGVNDDAGGDRSIDVTELWYEQALWNGKVKLRLGKIDLTGGFECRGCPVAFDGNAYANDETAQFLNGALVNNPTIPFPDNGLGAVAYVEPLEGWYLAGGIADAQADARETGFRTAFHGPDYFFGIFETGVAPRLRSRKGPLPGAYRIGLWYDPQAKDHLDGSGRKRDDVGFYLSCDQMLWRETDRPDNEQGVGAFARFGFADEEVNEVKGFWSLGCQYRGLIPGRDKDVLAVGVAQGGLSDDAAFTADHETAVELYYDAEIAPWLRMGLDLQYVANPGGDSDVKDAVVVGLRVQVSF